MDDFHSKRRVIVQLLKDWADQFGSTVIDAERTGGGFGDQWPISGEILKIGAGKSDVTRSKSLLAAELRRMRDESPYYTYLKRVFLTEGAAHSAYDTIKARASVDAVGVWDGIARLRRNFEDFHHAKGGHLARTLVTYWENNASDEMKLEHAIDLLTRRCEHIDLYCDYPKVFTEPPRPQTRSETTEEHHNEIRRVFTHYCDSIRADDPKAKKYRNKAINNTATALRVSTRTVMRAINAGEDTAA